MTSDDEALRRVRFYGVHDLAAGLHVARVAELIEQFDPLHISASAADVIELHNVWRYLENGLLPREYTDEKRAVAKSRMPEIRAAVGRFFTAIDDTNCGSRLVDVDYEYHGDLIELLAQHKAFERCGSAAMLTALDAAGLYLGAYLANRKLVDAYDAEIRARLLSDPRNAEHLARKFWQMDVREEIHLPAGFTPVDARGLLESYVDDDDANLNYVGLVETAPVSSETGVDAKLKLRAKRRKAALTKKLFEGKSGFKTGTEVSLSETQDEPVKHEMDQSDGFVTRFTYGVRWLEQTCDNPSILNNFQHLFEFTDRHVLLSFPSYASQLGALEGSLGLVGKTDYQVGSVFRALDTISLLQTRVYQYFLDTKGIDLEAVIAWFFDTYLVDEFGAENFSFTPSSSGTFYLQKVRHILAEMESVAAQFALFVEEGELDRDLLVMSRDGVSYTNLPSLLDGKYVYQGDTDEIAGVLNALFSDQSSLTYINQGLRGESFSALLIENQVAYDDFHDYQKHAIDQLISLGLVEDVGDQVRIANREQFVILRSLFTRDAVNYFHLSSAGRAEADSMVARGWATRRASLLTEAEGRYFSYFLNNAEFTNGPALRNKYLHGSQPNADGENAHFNAYITALRLILALVIKINDDFCLLAQEQESAEGTA